MIYLDLFFLGVIIFCVILSIKRGLFLEIISFWNLFISFVLTFTFFELVAKYLDNLLSSFFKYVHMSAEAISFSMLFIIFWLVFLTISNRIFIKIKINFISVIDKLGGIILGVIRGFIILSLILVVLAMSPITKLIWQEKENLSTARDIYLIVPKIYEFLASSLASRSYFDAQDFFNTYGGFLKEKTGSQKEEIIN